MATRVARAKEAAEEAILDKLQEADGRLDKGTVRGVAALIGSKKSTVHNAVSALIASGVVAKIGEELILRG
jgi:hypothetical protein